MWILIGILSFTVGAAFGWRRATVRQGTTADKVQYALAHGIPAFLIGMIVLVILLRMLAN